MDKLHRLVVDGLVVERLARVVCALVGVVRAVVGVVRAVVVMVLTIVVVIHVRHVLVRQAGGLRRGDELVSGDRFPVSYTHLTLPTIYSV